jgi:hypothetical protein
VTDLLTERELRALADCLEHFDAQVVLERAGIPHARQPGWTSTPASALDFWRAVNRLIEREKLADVRRRILAEAHAEFPGHPDFRPGATPAGVAGEPRISDDERRVHQRILERAAEQTHYTLTETWTIAELTALWRHLSAHRKDPGVTRTVSRDARNRLEILIRALNAWALLRELGVAGLQQHLLVHVYWRTVNGPLKPGATLERMLVAAAGVPDDPTRTVKKALVRFVVGLAGHHGVSPYQPALSAWLMEIGQSVDDAEAYRRQMGRPSWLLIDLGDEPRNYGIPEAGLSTVRGVLYTPDGQARSWTKQSPRGLMDAMQLLLEEVQAEQNVVVDLALPAPLMAQRVEHWEVVRSGSGYEPLSARYDTRLRWSLRLHQRYDHRRLPDDWRLIWCKDPCEIAGELLADQDRLGRWLTNREHDAYPYLMAAAVETTFDPLPMLLAHGSYFIIWLWPGADPTVFHTITEIAKPISPELRRLDLPGQITRGDRKSIAIIWDDPDGREGYAYSLSSLLSGLNEERS